MFIEYTCIVITEREGQINGKIEKKRKGECKIDRERKKTETANLTKCDN